MTDKMELYVMRRPGPEQNGLMDLISVAENRMGKGLKMVEIGSYAGESSEIFAKSGVFEKVICVDAWKNGYDDRDRASKTAEQAEGRFDNIAKKYTCIQKMKCDSFTAVKNFDNGSLDFVYIDAKNTYEAVKKNIEEWLPKIRKGGIIAGHDYGRRFKGVTIAVDKKFGKPDRTFCDSSWMKEINTGFTNKKVRANLVSLQFQPNIEVYKEWLTYHHALGFDNIFIFDNNRTDFDNETDPLPPLFDNVKVIPVTKFGKYRGGTQAVRFEYAKEYTTDADYIIVLDSDEFLYFKDNISVKQFLKRYEDLPFEQLCIPWIGIGSNKSIESGTSWINDFYKINKGKIPNNLYNDKREDLLCKAFLRTSSIAENDYMDGMHGLGYKICWRNAYTCDKTPVKDWYTQRYDFIKHPTPLETPARIYHFRWGYLDDIIKNSIRYRMSNFYGYLTNKCGKDRVVDNIQKNKLVEMYETRHKDYTIDDNSLKNRMAELLKNPFKPDEHIKMSVFSH